MKVEIGTNKLLNKVDSLIEKHIQSCKEYDIGAGKFNTEEISKATKIIEEVGIDKIKEDLIQEEERYHEVPHWTGLFNKRVNYTKKFFSYDSVPEYLKDFHITEDISRTSFSDAKYHFVAGFWVDHEYPFGERVIISPKYIGLYLLLMHKFSLEVPERLQKLKDLATIAKDNNITKVVLEEDDLNTLKYYEEKYNEL